MNRLISKYLLIQPSAAARLVGYPVYHPPGTTQPHPGYTLLHDGRVVHGMVTGARVMDTGVIWSWGSNR